MSDLGPARSTSYYLKLTKINSEHVAFSYCACSTSYSYNRVKIPSCKNFEAKEGMGVSSRRIHFWTSVGSGQVWVVRVSANLILTPQMMSNMTDYLNVPPTQRFFIKYGGKELDHLADRLEERFQFEFLASTKYRKLVATHVTSRKTLDTEKRRLVDVSQFSYGGNTTTEPSTIHTAYDLINGSRLLKPKQEP